MYAMNGHAYGILESHFTTQRRYSFVHSKHLKKPWNFWKEFNTPNCNWYNFICQQYEQ
jgi:hypothetical protein